MALILAQDKVRFDLPTQQQIPVGGTIRFYTSDPDGVVVDYENHIGEIEAWPSEYVGGKVGWGIAWGTGWAVEGTGWGWGSYWGAGWAVGGAPLRYVSSLLTDGYYTFGVAGVDLAGNVITDGAFEIPATVAGTPEPVTDLSAAAVDETDIKLTWTASTSETS